MAAVVICAHPSYFFNWFSFRDLVFRGELTRTIYNTLSYCWVTPILACSGYYWCFVQLSMLSRISTTHSAVLSHPNSSLLWLLMCCTTTQYLIYLSIILSEYLPPLSGYEVLCSSPVCVGTLRQVASLLFYQYFSSLKNFSLAFALLFFSADYCYAVNHVHGNKLPSGMEGEVLPNFICFVRILMYTYYLQHPGCVESPQF